MENIMFLQCDWIIFAFADGKVDGDWWRIWIYPAIGLVGVLLIYVLRQRGKKRTAALQAVAHELQLPFFPQGDKSLVGDLDKFHLFSKGHSKKISNMLHGENNHAELAVFDYRYRTGGGENSHTCHQTVIYFRCPTLNLPDFAVRPERLFHKIGTAFGYQDIDFETHPQFSQMYLLRGADQHRVRNLFSGERLAFFESQEKISVEGGGNQLIFYRHCKRVKPGEVRQFMEEGFRVFALFGDPPAAQVPG